MEVRGTHLWVNSSCATRPLTLLTAARDPDEKAIRPKGNARAATGTRLAQASSVLRRPEVVGSITHRPPDSISDVEKIRAKSEEYLSGSAYERIEKLPDISAFVIDMYASFGRLFINGQLGTCERRGYTTAPCTIRTKGNRDAKLWTEADLLLSKLWGLKGGHPFNRSLTTPTNDTPAGSYTAGLILEQTQEIFKRTWQFYAYLAGVVMEALNASESRDTDLGYLCRVGTGWAANTDTASVNIRLPKDDRAINLALHDVAPDCEEAEDDYARSLFARYAKNHGFGGGASNKCLQNFVVRYNNYDEDAYESFIGELHGYLFQDLTIYGMCIAFGEVSEDEAARRQTWVKQKLAAISSQLLKAREVLKETPPMNAPNHEVTYDTSSRWFSPRLPKEDVPTSAAVHSIVATVMKSDGSGIDQLPGKKRPSRYQGIIKRVVEAVKGKYRRFAANGSASGVMYVPQGDADKDLFCALPFPKNTTFVAQKDNYMGASYFIKWTENPTPPDVLMSRIAFIRDDRSNEDITWNTIFEQYENICDHVQLMMDSSTLGSYLPQTYTKEASGFTAVLAVRCTNEFVWYELGWRYYAAAATTASDYVISRADGAYRNSCGQLIFLP